MQVDVKEIMREIKEKINSDSITVNSDFFINKLPDGYISEDIFDNEVDVAGIMRNIIDNYNTGITDISFSSTNEKNITICLNEIHNEIFRIDEFVRNSRNNAEYNVDPALNLHVPWERPTLLRNMIIFIKRCVRKVSRYITLNQSEYNRQSLNCIQALQEENSHLLKLVDVLRTIYVEQQAEIETNKTIINELEKKIEKVHVLQQTEKTVMDELEKKMEEIYMAQHIEIDEDIYLKFEDSYRGSCEEISSRQTHYFNNYINTLELNLDSDVVVDLGCGRGEWVDYLQRNGINVVGIDMNEKMVNECKKKGLQVEMKDALAYLKSLDDESISVITGFQIIEHMPLNILNKIIIESFRVLRKQGKLIFETPNCKNVEVGSSNFYLDPTHLRPVHPDYLKFMVETSGFRESSVVFWKEEEIEKWLESVVLQDYTKAIESPLIRTILESLKNNFYCSPDYALVAIK